MQGRWVSVDGSDGCSGGGLVVVVVVLGKGEGKEW